MMQFLTQKNSQFTRTQQASISDDEETKGHPLCFGYSRDPAILSSFVSSDTLGQDDRLIPVLCSDLVSKMPFNAHTAPASASFRLPHLSQNLENLVSLLKKRLDERDQTIAQQSMQINAMKDELLRAEAQLDLLKDVLQGKQ